MLSQAKKPSGALFRHRVEGSKQAWKPELS